jgi:hypothetical protein
MQLAFPFVDISTNVELLATMITPQNPATLLVRDFKTDKTFIITRSDVIRVLCWGEPRRFRGAQGAGFNPARRCCSRGASVALGLPRS